MLKAVLVLAVVAVALAHHECDHEADISRAIARLDSEDNKVRGNVTFTKLDSGVLRVTGRIVGMAPGMYGFHVHETGDLTEGCESTKGHFNPDGNDHGHPHDDVRHAGDLGNVEFDKSGVANIDFVDKQIALNGAYSIVGRGLVLNERADDFGKTEHPDSKITGNAGAHVACGVIGILD